MWHPADLAVWAIARRLERTGPPVDTRTDIDTASLQRRFPRLADVSVTDVAVAGPHGEVPARHYRAPGESRAAFLWVHGGAFVGGDLAMPESNWIALELAARGIPVLAVDYRKALNGVTYPIPSDDVLAAWLWATADAEALFGVDPGRMHLGGASAGGTLVADVALRLRAGAGPAPASLVLAYALLHPRLPKPTVEAVEATSKLTGILRFRPSIVRAVSGHYAGRRGLREHAFIGTEADLTGLPPIYLLVAAIDDLRSSSETFARQLEVAGAPYEMFVEKSATHGYLNHPEAKSAQRSVKRLAAWILAHSDEG
jgi:acetyl esterase